MTRDDGFPIADTDTGMLSDPKVLALARRLHDSIRTGAAIALYDAVRLASWKAGCRLTLDETVPGWWLDPVDDLAAELVAVDLLDSERRLPAHAWEGWFGPAFGRRLDASRKSIFGGLVSHGMTPEAANREADRRIAVERARLGLAQPYSSELLARPPTVRPSIRPSVPSVQVPDMSGQVRDGDVSLKETDDVPPSITPSIGSEFVRPEHIPRPAFLGGPKV
jgi:hypothetical protein